MKHVIVTVIDMTREMLESIETLPEENWDLLDEKGGMPEGKGRMLREDGPTLERRRTRLRDDGPLLESSGRRIEIEVPMYDDGCRLLRCKGRFPRANAGFRLTASGFSTFPPLPFGSACSSRTRMHEILRSPCRIRRPSFVLG